MPVRGRSGRVRIGGRASGAVASQSVNAGGSLVIQIAAARTLGAGGFGSFVLLTSSLVLLTALYTAFVGDSLTVLDRRDPRIRGALIVAHAGLSGLAAVIGYCLALALDLMSPGAALLYAALVFLWLNEELGRRIFMARLEFWKLTANDSVYVAVTLACLAGLRLAGVGFTVTTVVLSMTAGAVAAIIVAIGQIPSVELRPARLEPGALGEVAAFATWRSLQAGLRPMVLFVARALIGGIAGRPALGRVEAARLLLAPAQTLVSAAGNVLLPMYVPGRDTGGRNITVRRASTLLIACTVVVGAVAVVFAAPLSRLVVGDEIAVPRTAVMAWAVYTCALALGLPAGAALVARRMSKTVFVVRLADAVGGLAILLVVLATHHATASPLALAASAAVSAMWLQTLAGRLPDTDKSNTERAGSELVSVLRTVPSGVGFRSRARSMGPVGLPMRRFLTDGSRWALALAVLPLMLASDYKVRQRDQQASVGGQPDVFVLFEIAVYVTVAVVLMLTVAHAPQGRRRTALINLSWIFACYLALAAAWSPYRSLAIIRGAQLLLTAGIAQSIARYARRDQLHCLAHAFAAMVTLSVLFGLAVPFPPVSPIVAGRFTWLYVHPVISGIYLGAATVILFAYLMRSGREHRVWPGWVYPAMLVIVTYGLLATRTRGALAGAVVAVVFVTICGTHGAARAELLTAIGITTAIAVATESSTILAFISRGESTQQLSSLNSRTNLWSLAFQAFDKKPVEGWGLTASRGIFYSDIGLGGGHNAFINVLVDGGIIGVVVWSALLTALMIALRKLWRHVPGDERADLTLLSGVVAFLLIDGLTAEGSAAPANVGNILLFTLVGWTGALQRGRLRGPPVTPSRMAVTSS